MVLNRCCLVNAASSGPGSKVFCYFGTALFIACFTNWSTTGMFCMETSTSQRVYSTHDSLNIRWQLFQTYEYIMSFYTSLLNLCILLKHPSACLLIGLILSAMCLVCYYRVLYKRCGRSLSCGIFLHVFYYYYYCYLPGFPPNVN